MNLKQKFEQLKKEGKKAFIAYVPFGFPSIAKTKDIILTLQEAGVDIIELGIPFSDPIADGPIIQAATTLALQKGANTYNLFETLKALKKDLRIPCALMTYYNPVFKFGVAKFFEAMQKIDVCGILTVDLPVDEATAYCKEARRYKRETIFFITPVTPATRAQKIIKASSGFIYYVSVTGTTGPRELDAKVLTTHITSLKKRTTLPVCVGFGIHTSQQVKRIGAISDGVIIGSSIVKFISDNHSGHDFLRRLKEYVTSLRGGD
ncbi:MAG: tryptophan synthase subunit alpha [Candidatus Omnitrophica bacterium]|nr:tryptophan synthase subunit alpha [Candidatus Omnitrophota bacterium]